MIRDIWSNIEIITKYTFLYGYATHMNWIFKYVYFTCIQSTGNFWIKYEHLFLMSNDYIKVAIFDPFPG
jgi:hypothetical protein